MTTLICEFLINKGHLTIMIFGPMHVKNWKPQYEYIITVCSKIYLLLLPKVCELIFSRWPRHVDRLLLTTTTVDDVGCSATATKFSSRFTKAQQPNNKPKQRRSAVQRWRVDLCLYKKISEWKNPIVIPTNPLLIQ